MCVWLVVLALMSRLHCLKTNIEASDKAKTRFMANITHELRTPLNAILGYTQTFKTDADLMKTHKKGVDTVHYSAEHLLALINDVLNFSKGDSHHLTLHPSNVKLPSFIDTLVAMIKTKAQIKNIAAIVKFDGLISDLVYVDQKRLRQILLNLLNNAITFTNTGCITLTVAQFKNKRKNTSLIKFSILDTGIGIPEDKLKDIFIPYQQIDNAMTQAEGSGLGLTISKNLIELMESILHVSSNHGPKKSYSGSCFWFELSMPKASKNGAILKASQISKHQLQKNTATSVQELKLPPLDELTKLNDASKNHDVLAVKQLMDEWENDEKYQAFMSIITPFTQDYRFSELLKELAKLES